MINKENDGQTGAAEWESSASNSPNGCAVDDVPGGGVKEWASRARHQHESRCRMAERSPRIIADDSGVK